jgi:hypothetical protein
MKGSTPGRKSAAGPIPRKEDSMKNFTGGLFKTEEEASGARRALREAGFSREDVTILARRPEAPPVDQGRAQAPDMGKAALTGALILGILAGLFGLLAGLAIIPIPGVDAATYRISPGFVLTSVLSGVIAGAITGAILGVATRLLASRDRMAITSQGIKRGGLLVVARVGQMSSEETARRVLEQHGAVDIQNLTERWDQSVWSELTEVPQPNQRSAAQYPRK